MLDNIKVPLVVDLDGTLIQTDTLLELLLALIKKTPWIIFLLPVWLLRGKAYFKYAVANRVELNPALLPYHQAFLNYLQQQKQHGRRLILATAANERIAHKIADYLGLFTTVLASDEKNNLVGARKLVAIKQHCDAFVYAGNEANDLPIWRAATAIIIISRSPRLLKQVQQLHIPIEYQCITPLFQWQTVMAALRMHQWGKNILIFVPLLTAYKFTNLSLFFLLIAGFFALNLCASSGYLINDLFDLTTDRQHARKSTRPFASGALPLVMGFYAIPLLLITSFILAFYLSTLFALFLATYFVLTMSYTFYFKKIVLVDVILLALFYVLRIIMGGVVVQVPLSEWLLAFSLFFFLSLAFVKRVSELQTLRSANQLMTVGRGYLADDLEQIMIFGTCSGYIAILIFALFINSASIITLYHSPQWLWLCCPLLLYWISRIWLLTHRGFMHDDPVLFAIKDKMSYVVGFFILILLWLAK